jgi:hypothetical protein
MTSWVIEIWTMRRPVAFALLFVVAVVLALAAGNLLSGPIREQRDADGQRNLLRVHTAQIEDLQREQRRLRAQMDELAPPADKGR